MKKEYKKPEIEEVVLSIYENIMVMPAAEGDPDWTASTGGIVVG